MAASLQNTSLDNKTIGWGATGKSAWGQNRLLEASRLRRDRVELDKRHIIHPQAILQPEREANLRPETILAMVQVFVTLHNDILSAPVKEGFALLDDNVSLALVENSALFNLGEMARISPWINKQGVLVLDFVFNIGLKNAQCVQKGRKAQILAREGALASGAPPGDSGQPMNKAARDWLLMGAEKGKCVYVCVCMCMCVCERERFVSVNTCSSSYQHHFLYLREVSLTAIFCVFHLVHC